MRRERNSSDLFSYLTPVCDLERVMGIEPTLAAWEAAVLPLNYTRAVRHYTDWGQMHSAVLTDTGPVHILDSRAGGSVACPRAESVIE